MLSKKIKVSVIIPVFNGEKFIGKAVESVLNQTFHDYEIIIVDDASTDSTSLILKEYNDNDKIAILQNITNKGQASAINYALSKARGKYIAYLDCDDIMNPERLSSQVRLLDNNPNLGLVYSDVNYVDVVRNTRGQKKTIIKEIGQKFSRPNSLLVLNCIVRSSVMHRFKCIYKVGLFDQKITGSDDWDMWLRISETYSVMKINKMLIDKIAHSSNISRTRTNKHYYHENSIKIIEKAYLRRGKPSQIKILLLSKKLRLSIVKNIPISFSQSFVRLVHKLMYYVDWSICIMMPRNIIKNRIY